MEILAIDVGNSRITCAEISDGQIGKIWHHPTSSPLAAAQSIASAANQRTVALCSVVPAAGSVINNYLQSHSINVVPISAEQPFISGTYTTMGADRAANAVGGWMLYGKQNPIVVIDLGTATTLTAVSKHARYCGGYITLGLGSTLSALHHGAAQLPDVSPLQQNDLKTELGHDTQSAMFTGTLQGHIGLLKQWLEIAERNLGEPVKKIATGGWSKLLAEQVDFFDVVDADLTLKGIYFITQAAKVPKDPG